MNILVHGRFYPSIGGIETVLSLLATHWQRVGENVAVVSDVACPDADPQRFPFDVQYRPAPLHWQRLVRWADVFVHMNLSLKALWPLWLVKKPFVVVHHGFYYSDSARGTRDWRQRLKLRLLDRACNIGISQAVADRLPARCVVIPNPFDESVFHMEGSSPRHRELIFVGRLVSEKGADLLLFALGRLAKVGLRPCLTIVGDGPERDSLNQLVQSLGLVHQVAFAGACAPREVAALLRQHTLLVVPSVTEEAFGVVALEGAACGCVVLGANSGGLPEAIGPSGLTYRRGDLGDLTSKLAGLLLHHEECTTYQQAAPAHLERHRAARIAERYLTVFRSVVATHRSADASSAPSGGRPDAGDASALL